MRDPTTKRVFGASTAAAVGGCALSRIGLLVISVTLGGMAQAVAAEPREPLHFTVNLRGDFAGAASAGFNLADVSTLPALRALPEGMKGVYWLGNGYKGNKGGCSWQLSDRQITDAVMAIKDNPKFSGIYYIADEPHPALCPDAPQRLAERTALIHSLDPRGRTFVVVLNGSTGPDRVRAAEGCGRLHRHRSVSLQCQERADRVHLRRAPPAHRPGAGGWHSQHPHRAGLPDIRASLHKPWP